MYHECYRIHRFLKTMDSDTISLPPEFQPCVSVTCDIIFTKDLERNVTYYTGYTTRFNVTCTT